MDSLSEQQHRQQQQQQQSQHNATSTQESSQQQEPDMAAMGLPASFGGAAMRGASREAREAFPTGDSGRGSGMVSRGRGGAARGADRGRGHVSDRGAGHDGGMRGRGGRPGRGRGRGEGWSGQRRGGGGGGPSFADRGHHHPHGPGQMHGIPPERTPQAFFKPSFLEDPWAHLS